MKAPIPVTDLDIDDWFVKLSDEVDLWITDPPYPFNSQNGTNRFKGMYQRLTWKKFEDIYKNMYNKTADGGRAYVFCNRDGLAKTISLMEDSGFKFRNILIWDKQHFGGGYHWRNQVEYIVYCTRGKPKTYVKKLSNVFNYKRPSKKDIDASIQYDPTGTSCKPYQIWSDIINHGGCQGDICADPFAGSNPMRAALLKNPLLLKKIKKAYINSHAV